MTRPRKEKTKEVRGARAGGPSRRAGLSETLGRAGKALHDKLCELPRGRQKDEARTLAMLWGPQDRAGRSRLSVAAIVEAAIEIADEEGLEAVSMRRIADILGVGTMTLYTHVPGKAELTDLMLDAAYAGIYADVDEPKRQGDYRAGIQFVAERNRALYAAHEWMLELAVARPVLGPNLCAKFEAELRVLDGIGLTDPEIDAVASQLLLHVNASSRYAAEERRAQQDTGLTEMEWWAKTIPMLERVMTGSFPTASRVGPAANAAMAPMTASEHHYRWGVEVVCQTVATLIRNRDAQASLISSRS